MSPCLPANLLADADRNSLEPRHSYPARQVQSRRKDAEKSKPRSGGMLARCGLQRPSPRQRVCFTAVLLHMPDIERYGASSRYLLYALDGAEITNGSKLSRVSRRSRSRRRVTRGYSPSAWSSTLAIRE